MRVTWPQYRDSTVLKYKDPTDAAVVYPEVWGPKGEEVLQNFIVLFKQRFSPETFTTAEQLAGALLKIKAVRGVSIGPDMREIKVYYALNLGKDNLGRRLEYYRLEVPFELIAELCDPPEKMDYPIVVLEAAS